MRTDFE